jgi:hypothetical protein
MYHDSLLVVMWGNFLGQSFFLEVTLSSGQVEWSSSSSSHSFEVHSCEKFQRMVCFGGWCMGNRQSFPRADSSSPGFTVISVGRMTQLSEWSRFNNQGYAFPRERLILSRLHYD